MISIMEKPFVHFSTYLFRLRWRELLSQILLLYVPFETFHKSKDSCAKMKETTFRELISRFKQIAVESGQFMFLLKTYKV